MEVGARPATPGDVPTVAGMLFGSASTVARERGGPVFVNRELPCGSAEDQVSAYLDDPAAFVAVGTLEDVVLGGALARVETLRDGSVLGRLEYLWVDPGAREVGVGAELMALVEAWATAAGASRLDAYVLPGNRAAKNFLEMSGYSARLIVMHRTLTAQAAEAHGDEGTGPPASL